VYVKFPYGAPLGEPGDVNQQRTILKALFDALVSIQEVGKIVDLPYRWRREHYGPVSFHPPEPSQGPDRRQ